MKTIKITTPTNPVITLNAIKDHLRIERDETEFDADLQDITTAAIDMVESETNTTLLTTTFAGYWDHWPIVGTPLKIPGNPVTAVNSVTYTDTAGNSVVWDPADYQFSTTRTPAIITPAPGTTYPALLADSLDSVSVEFVAGYGTTSDDVPELFKHLIKLLVGHWFRNREAVLVGSISKRIELAFMSIRNQVWENEFTEFARQ
jgi:uncharacterized phiE125 gp8 family phage protein